MWIAVEYGRYFLGCFKGDIDEVRVSKVTRSADWVKMEYENQKPLQTMVGPLVQAGNAFSVSPASIEVDEGKSATVTAHAGGAQKLYWLVKKDGVESIAAVDQYSYTLDAGRVVGDTSYSLQLKAVYPDGVKTKDIPVTVKETIPEPVFTLKAPSRWNGRDTIEVVPEIRNLAAMTAQGAGELHYRWTVSGGAVIKEVVPGKLVLKRSQYTGSDHRQGGDRQWRAGYGRHDTDPGDRTEKRSVGAEDSREGRKAGRRPVLRPRRQQ